MEKLKKGFILLMAFFMIFTFGCNSTNQKKPVKNEIKKTQNEAKKTAENNKDSVNQVKKEDAFPKGVPMKNNTDNVCILMYHSIEYQKNNNLRMPKEKFRQQMKYIKDNGYTTLTLNELYDFLEHNKPIPKKSVVITLDDGYVDNYTNAYPILKEYGLKATVFMITNAIDTDKTCLNSKQLKEMDKNGIDIESHTTNHKELSKQPYDVQFKMVNDSKLKLEKLLNKKILYIAYPAGKYNEDTIKAVKKAGYKMAFTTGGKLANKSQGIYKIKRIGVYADNGLNTVKGNLNIK